MREISAFLSVILLCGCGPLFDEYSRNDATLHVQAHPNHEGVYTVTFNVTEVVNAFGQGMRALRKEMNEVPRTDRWSIWRGRVKGALRNSLYAKDVVPKECNRGIRIIEVGTDEMGGGGAAFRCR